MTLRGRLPTTRWSLVVRAGGDRTDPMVRRSLEELCQSYWPPLYAYLRRRGTSAADAEDDVQGFFADLLSRDDLARVDASRGRFRAFVFTALDHYVAKRVRHETAQRRGGHVEIISLQVADSHRMSAESLTQWELTDNGLDAEALFDRNWARWLVSKTFDELRAEYTAEGKQEWFDALSCFLSESDAVADRRCLAEQLGLSATALKVAIHRLRAKFRSRLVTAVAETVDDPAEIGQERRLLFDALS